ncbi:glucan endo-1,3-beta-D-glucosidase-like [Chenopodium quinoa]|uniref:glucan endo-1,3-beta-D-glucosidase-like n=1 Tax=Chenopodium quinoa TaxID=63459 RepID=UPI000B78F584|nr:glucan endo-1,3-beta-D-glucosidase-like [Chenopodium quinoa]XP_021731600.1 glucan endo-1,3-beta-D-glucosidase-like [Chenopodium quinoa]
MEKTQKSHLLHPQIKLPLIFSLLLCSLLRAEAQSYLGINYGLLADNLPPPEATAKLLKTTPFTKVRLYGADPGIIKALGNTGIGIVIGADNGDIPALASDPSHATQWVNSNVLAFPDSKIILITVGNEVISSGDQDLISQLVPAMQNIQDALTAAKLDGKIQVSTVHSMAVMGQSDPPSSGAFVSELGDTMKKLLEFQKENGSPFTINPYPFFAYQSDPRPDTLAFCLFQPNAGRVDPGSNIKYMNMFDAQVDAIRSALNALGFKDIDIVVAETGWPYRGDSNEVGPSIENAKAYNGGLISHLRSMAGTPLMPGKSVDTYIFALYDEDLKPGPTSEKSFGLFKPDLSMTYDIGLTKGFSQAPTSSPSKSPANSSTSPAPSTTTSPSKIPSAPSKTPLAPSATPTAVPGTPPKSSGTWCVPKKGVSVTQLQANLNYACSQGIDCSKIQAGGPCYDPNTVASHAAYAMNLLYQKAGRTPGSCDFTQTATVTSTNPSYGSCVYPSDGNARVSLGAGLNKSSASKVHFSLHWSCWWCLCFVLSSFFVES